MPSFALERHLESPTSLTFPTPLLLGMEFTERSTVLENELVELQRIHQKNDWVFDLGYTERYLQRRTSAIIVTDTHQHITWTSRGFVRMTGYSYCEAYRQKPTFLQGPRTLQTTRTKIRETLQAGKVFEGSIVNYRKSGAVYSCQVTIIPILNSASKLTNFIALEEEKKNFFHAIS